MILTPRDYQLIAIHLGHQRVWCVPTTSGRRWEVGCECGWGARIADGQPTVTRATEVEGVKTVMWHLKRQAEAYISSVRVNGGQIPAEVLAGR